MIVNLLALGAFFTLTVALYALFAAAITRRQMQRRLRLASGAGGQGAVEYRLAAGTTLLRDSFSKQAAALGGLLPLSDEDRAKIATALARAGFQSANAVPIVLGLKVVGLLAGLVLGFFLLQPLYPGIMGWLSGLVGGLFFGVGFNLLPEFAVSRLAAARMRRVHSGLADTFDLLVVCLESGHTFEHALQRTVVDLRSIHPELAGELRQVSFDMNLHGRTREAALGRLADRLDSQDFRDLATTVTQSERQGTPVADALRKFAASHRVELIAGIQARTARLPVLLILPTLIFVLPGMMVIVGGPALVQLTESLATFGGP